MQKLTLTLAECLSGSDLKYLNDIIDEERKKKLEGQSAKKLDVFDKKSPKNQHSRGNYDKCKGNF